MKLSFLFFSDKPDMRWDLTRQMGIKYALAKLTTELTGKLPPWDFDSLADSKKRFADGGFKLIGLEGDQMDMSRIKLGLPGRDEDIGKYCQMLENMGKLGINLLCYNFMVTGWYRTHHDTQERGGALVTSFDYRYAQQLTPALDREITDEEVWDNYRYFIRYVIPVAEEAGVKMGLHPDDPPISPLRGVGRYFTSPERIRQALALTDSPSHGLSFCQGTYKTMGLDLAALINEWGGQQKIFFVHIRDVAGTPENFRETFHDNGPTDMPAMLKLYNEIGFTGLIRSDHVPTMAGEENTLPGYAMNGNLFGIGYIKGMMDALKISSNI